MKLEFDENGFTILIFRLIRESALMSFQSVLLAIWCGDKNKNRNAKFSAWKLVLDMDFLR